MYLHWALLKHFSWSFQNNFKTTLKDQYKKKHKMSLLTKIHQIQKIQVFWREWNYNKEWNNRNENYNQQWNKLNIRPLVTQHVCDMDWKWIIQNNIGFNDLHVSCFRVLRSIQKLQDSWSTCSFLDWEIVLHFKDMGESLKELMSKMLHQNICNFQWLMKEPVNRWVL